MRGVARHLTTDSSACAGRGRDVDNQASSQHGISEGPNPTASLDPDRVHGSHSLNAAPGKELPGLQVLGRAPLPSLTPLSALPPLSLPPLTALYSLPSPALDGVTVHLLVEHPQRVQEGGLLEDTRQAARSVSANMGPREHGTRGRHSRGVSTQRST
jgi:hypothetical protein